MPAGIIVIGVIGVVGIVTLVVAMTTSDAFSSRLSSKKKRSSTTLSSTTTATRSQRTRNSGADDLLRPDQEPTSGHEYPTPLSQGTVAERATPLVESTRVPRSQSTPKPSILQPIPLIQVESGSDHSSTPLATPTVLEQFDPFYSAQLSPLGSPITLKAFDSSARGDRQPTEADTSHPVARSQYPLLEVPQSSSGGSSPLSPADSAYKSAISSPLSADSFHSARDDIVFSPASQRNSLSLDEATSRVRLDIGSWSAMVQPQEAGKGGE